MDSEQISFLQECKDIYDADFIRDVMPFWLKYGLDREYGGVFTCLDRDGGLMDTTKSVWFQGRFAYICAYAYNNVEKKAEWLESSKRTIDFIDAHCFDADGHMFFLVTKEGSPIQKRRYVFSECFTAIAFAEYSIASGDKRYATRALEVFVSMQKMLSTPGFLSPKTTVEAKGHSMTMMCLNVVSCIRRAIQDDILEEQVQRSLEEIEKCFMNHEYKTVLEVVGPSGELIDTCAGRTINPGHCIETAWFILAEARHRNWDKGLVEMARTIFDWAWDWGWDEKHGGIINFMDCKGFPSQDYSQDMKFWWPQCEAIIATLYLYVATKDQKYLDLHKKIHEYTYSHFPDRRHGEWYGYLHRDGTIAQPAKGNLFKGPFHVPRMMMSSSALCDEILNFLK